jgi:glutamate/tyrosine decarboxylase-like PLP-dependent enzyme
VKAAKAAGIGTNSMRYVATGAALRMDTGELERILDEDRRAGCCPVLVCSTAGTTTAGVIDPILEAAAHAAEAGAW